MKKLATLGVAAAIALSIQAQPQQAEARSLGRMIDSAINTLSGRNAYWDNMRYYGYGNPYFGGYGYNPYVNYGYGYGYGYSPYSNYNRYYGVYPSSYYGWF